MKNNKNKIRIISYLTALVAVLFISNIVTYNKAMRYKNTVRNSYMSSLSQLNEKVVNINSSLKKGMYVSSPPAFSMIAANIWQDASSAKAIIGTLPLEGIDLSKMTKFISQSGEYALSLLKKTSSGQPISDSERENIRSLSNSANAVASELSSLKSEINSGKISLTEIRDGAFSQINSTNSTPNKNYLSGIQDEFPEYASLIYDGPYSDHIEKLEPEFLKGKSELSENQLIERAADILKINSESITQSSGSNGKIKTMCYLYSTPESSAELELTRIGGYILNYSKYRRIGNCSLSVGEAVDLAKTELNKLGFNNLKESYYTIFENRITVNFAYSENDVICYPDLIKVSVALDNGEIIGIESYGFIMNHKNRNISEPDISKSQAEAVINKDLKILSSGVCIIPTSGKNEMLCYEVKTLSPENIHYIFYVNCQTGYEENVFILIEDSNGVLTI